MPESQDKAPVVRTTMEGAQKEDTKPVPATTSTHHKPKSSSAKNVGGLTNEFLTDQKQIWTSPIHLRLSDMQWLVPMSGISAALFVTDKDYNQHLSHDPTTISHYKTLSDVGVGALIGGAGGMWLLGHVKHNNHWSETGFLAGEAALNSLVMVEGLKYSFGRERPLQGNGSGQFFQGGSSFPSEHAAAAWSVAGVLAHEYPGPLMKIAAYGLASLVDYSRVHGQQHFPSDVFVGTVIGNLIAQDIYSRRHDPGLGGTAYGSIRQFLRGDGKYTPANMGSPYVPLDSWVYPAFDRLIALGYIRSAILGMRPWTRLECARLLNEADDRLSAYGFDDTRAIRLYESLAREFSGDLTLLDGGENASIQVESLYSRFTGISGPPLTDGYHFAQTISNDFGRPFSEGFNAVDGFSGWASEGRLTAYLRAEYQVAPATPALPLAAREFIARVDGVPVPPATGSPAVNQLRLLDSYLALNISNWQFSFGKQSLWWGPSDGGPMIFSDNAEPALLFRIDRVSPFTIPWVSRLLGPMRLQFILGQLSGHHFVFGAATGLVGQYGQTLNPQPMIDGLQFNFKPTPDFEFGVVYTTVVGGPGMPFTFHKFLQSMFSTSNGPDGSDSDPGDRRSGVNFNYRIPKFRKWLLIYGDAFTEDEFSPLGYWRKSAYEGGLYVPRIPGIPKLDLRLEGGSSEPADFGTCVGCFYYNGRYTGGYTNQGNLMGSWLGRAGQSEQVWSTLWLTPRDTIQFNYQHFKAVANFVPDGGTLNNAGVSANIWWGQSVKFSGSVQFEKWNYPLLAPNARTNVSTSVGLSFWPHNWGLQAH